jgi:serine protease
VKRSRRQPTTSTSARRTRGFGVIGLFALALLGGTSVAQAQDGESLVPRTPPQKPEQSTVPSGYSRERIHLKFKEGTGVRLRGGRFQLGSGAELSAVEAVLAQYPEIRATRLFERPEGVLAAEKARIERESGREQADKNLYYRLVLPPDTNAAALIDDLNGLDVVEIAYAEPLPAPPPVTPDFTSRQRYRLAAGVGVDALYANAIPGGTGGNVEIVDVEYSWDQNHEDLSKAAGALIPNGTPTDPFSDTNHGTAVIGELIGDPNSFGVTGIAHGAGLGLVNANNTSGYNLAAAIDVAHANLTNGDAILIEQQVAGNGPCDSTQVGCVAVEWVQAYYDSIVSAVDDGIVVVEPAGNGNQNLDDAFYGNPFPAGRADSGAIIVGAGTAGSPAHAGCTGTNPAHGRMSFSTYGSRVDLQGWGQCVVTTGYGDLQGPPNPLYTNDFGGTSSASPIVTSAAAILSSVAQQRGFSLVPRQIRALLKATGTPQVFGLSGNIGPLPNLRSALESLSADSFSSPQPLSRASVTRTRDSNAAASKQSGEPNHAGNAGGASIWYRWTPTDSGKVTIDTAGSSFDTLLAVYTGSAVGSLSLVASNDDVGGGLLTSRLNFHANAGTTYRIAVDGFNGVKGSINLRLDQSPRAPGARAVADFDNDGFADLAIGAPGENSGSTPNAGAVNILYGSAGGLASAGAQQFTQSQAAGAAEAHDRFGSALAAGDFNADGFADLAVGVPDEDSGTIADVGVVNVLRGSASGLTSTGAAQFTQSQAAGALTAGDRFGAALTAGNFSGTTADELAIGAPDENAGFAVDVGVVNVLRGSASGLTSTGAAQFTQAQSAGTTETSDRFGAALAAANMSGDGFAELAVGAPDEDVSTGADAGSVSVLRGASGGLTGTGAQLFLQSQAAGTAETDDRFGAALTAGNFSGDSFAELAIGAPDEDSGTTAAVGVVNVLRGTAGGLTSTGAAQFTQSQAGGATAANDLFGSALAAANLSGDGFAELAVGAPGENSGLSVDIGVLNVLRGAAGGLTSTGAAQFTQSQAAGTSESDDRFGAALSVGNFNADGFADVAAGAPDEDSGATLDVGVVNILRGASAGLTSTGAAQFTQSQAGGATAAGDQFGGALG